METSVTYEHPDSLILNQQQPGSSNGYSTFQQQDQQQQLQHQPYHNLIANHHQHQQHFHHIVQTQPLTAAPTLGTTNNNNDSTIAGVALAGTSSNFTQLHLPPLPIPPQTQQYRNPYQYKCSLLEYHIHEAILINKALKSELQQYREKIEFEKKLRSVLIERVKNLNPTA